MVLEQLGSQITQALSKLNNSTLVNEDILDEVLKEVSTALILGDVNIRLVAQLRQNVKKICLLDSTSTGNNRTKQIRKAVFDELVGMLTPEKTAYVAKKGKPNVFMFVGLQGSGKTTTIAKLGHYYQRKGWKVCFVCCDTFRAGAFDQIKQNALKLHIPYYGSPVESDPVKIAKEGTEHFKSSGYEIILVDTSGRHKQEQALFEEMKQIEEVVNPDEIVFVLDSTIGQGVFDQAKTFREEVSLGSVIITKMDSGGKGGGALAAVAATDSPVSFIGTGEHFDEFEPFEPRGFTSRLLGMGDLKGLISTFRDRTDLLQNAPEMMQRLQKGVFTLRDMRQQFESVMKMGNLSQLMGMVPGMNQVLNQPGMKGQDASKRIQMFLTCLDSMTANELDGILTTRKYSEKERKFVIVQEKHFSESRIRRIAVGSGTSMALVAMLLQCHKQFEKMVEKMGKTGLMNQTDAGMAQRLQRNPQAVMSQLQKSLDPRLMKQMGGAQNMMQMIKQMGSMDMQEMMKGMNLGALGGAAGALGGAADAAKGKKAVRKRR